jgi:hypothetical protein
MSYVDNFRNPYNQFPENEVFGVDILREAPICLATAEHVQYLVVTGLTGEMLHEMASFWEVIDPREGLLKALIQVFPSLKHLTVCSCPALFVDGTTIPEFWCWVRSNSCLFTCIGLLRHSNETLQQLSFI